MYRRLFVSINPPYVRHVRENTRRVQNPDISRAGRVGRTAGRRGGAGQDWTPTKQFAQKRSISRTLQGIEE